MKRRDTEDKVEEQKYDNFVNTNVCHMYTSEYKTDDSGLAVVHDCELHLRRKDQYW